MEVSGINVQAPEVTQKLEAPVAKAPQVSSGQPEGAGASRTEAMVQKSQAESAKRAEATQEMVEKTAKIPKPDEVVAAIIQINEWLNNRQVEVTHDKDAGKDVYRLVEKDSGEIIIQFPSEEVLNISRRIAQMMDAQQGQIGKQAGIVAGALMQRQA